MAYHPLSKGRPEGHLFQELSTRAVAPADRFDFWSSEVVRNFSVRPPDAWQRKNFLGNVTSLATVTGELHYAETDGFDADLTKHTIADLVSDELSLILVLDGQVGVRRRNGQARTLTMGGFFLLDGLQTAELHFSRSSFIQLDLSRPLLEALFPGAVPPAAFVGEALARSRLADLLRDHLRQFPRCTATMSPAEQVALLDASESLALATIGAACATLRDESEPFGPGLFAAAQRHIERHLADPALCPDAVAAALGCSRATLYRLFTDRQWAVREYIRELRLRKFLHLLQTENRSVHIWVLARRCGLYDSSNLGRMFRRRFGMSPAEARSASDRS